MNSRILMAFLAGAAFAAGIVFMVIREPDVPIQQVSAASKPIYVAPPAEDPQESSPIVDADITPVPQRREKRSPMPPAERSTRATLGGADRKQETIAQAAPAPLPAAPPELEPEPAAEPAPALNTPTAPAPAPKRVEEPLPAPEPTLPVRQPHTVTITAGTLLPVRIGETISANRNQPGDNFLATLDQPLVVDGFVIAERGARLEGRVMEADLGGRVLGTSYLDIALVKLSTSDGQHVSIRSSPYHAQSHASLLTRGKPASIPVATRVSFRLQYPVTLTERLR